MGNYLNPSTILFQMDRQSDIYVDKSMMLEILNRKACTADRFVCVSRPRRFGKTMATNLIAAYYEYGVDTDSLFKGLKIQQSTLYDKYKNAFDVLKIIMQDFLSRASDVHSLIQLLTEEVLTEFESAYPAFSAVPEKGLPWNLEKAFECSGRQIVFIIDEWDCIFREFPDDTEAQKDYLDFLRDLMKDKGYIALAYMTGILPIKKYGTQSALNMFTEISMEDPGEYTEYTGFTSEEVDELCERFGMNASDCRDWYDGYLFHNNIHIYNPRSLVLSMTQKKFADYWNRTETYEALKLYIDMNFDGLRDAILTLLAGERRKINTGSFQNDMSTMKSADDVLSLLIHLGYLGYDLESSEVYIPNRELMLEFITATTSGNYWDEVVRSVKQSDELLKAVWSGDEEVAAAYIENAHLETSHIQYNDENALSYTISLAFYAARQYYTVIRELPTGKGFADLAFVPRKQYADKPAMVVELKWNQDADTALRQIREKSYPIGLSEYKENMLLVGIDYDKETRKHECRIEKAL